ncbi:hypothetical protein ACP275_11G112500 [Erythranthe tilingii]
MDNNPILQSSNKHARRQIYAFRPSGVENSPEYLLSFPGGGYIRVPTGCVLFHNGCVLPENFNIRRTTMNFYPPIVPPLPDLPQGHVNALLLPPSLCRRRSWFSAWGLRAVLPLLLR